jgi:hypothetical protein
MTERAIEIATFHATSSSISATARHFGIGRSSVQDALMRAARHGKAPGLVAAPGVPGMAIGKTTVQYDADGKIIQEWRRLFPEATDVETWIATLEDRVKAKAPKIKEPKPVEKDLLLEIPIPDHHLGMLSWPKETGASYDANIATELLVNGVASVIAECPRPGKIALVVMGDYYHADGRTATTERSGAPLDVDSRFCRRIDQGIEALCRCIELAAAAAKEVEVIVISGNHDWHSCKWLARVVGAYYRSTPRITVRTDPKARQYIVHGKVMLCYMHGDTMKSSRFAQIVPTEATAEWGATEFRYGRIGHWHHRVTEEHPGIVVETLPTLAAPDAWAIEGGYLSRRAMTAYLWSSRYGLRSKMERSVQEILDYSA